MGDPEPEAIAGGIVAGKIKDAGAKILGDKLEFIAGKSRQKTVGLTLERTINTRNQSGYQTASHGRVSCR